MFKEEEMVMEDKLKILTDETLKKIKETKLKLTNMSL